MQEEIIKRIKELQKGDYLPLYGDLQFKYIYGTFKIKSEVKLNRETVSSKSFELDVVVELSDGSITNLEMQ